MGGLRWLLREKPQHRPGIHPECAPTLPASMILIPRVMLISRRPMHISPLSALIGITQAFYNQRLRDVVVYIALRASNETGH